MNISWKKNAFTFVELIVVIVILAIIWVIWFYTLNTNIEWARDSSKITALNNIKTTLINYKINKWFYPTPSNHIDVTYSWSTVWSQWTFWKDVSEKVDWSKEKILDPYTKNEYAYSITSNKKEFQLAGVLENNSKNISYNNILISSSFAATNTRKGKVEVLWDYNWNMIFVNVLWVNKILSIPSIIASDLSSTNLVDIMNNNKFVYNWWTNLPENYKTSVFNVNGWENFSSNKLVIFSWNLSNLKKEKNRLKLLLQLKRSYNWSKVNNSKWRYLKDINIDLVHPSSRALALACDLVQFELNYPVKCNNESFFAVPVVNNTGLNNIDFSGLLSQKVSSVVVDSAWVAWFGTNKGLSTYSGWIWMSYTTWNWLVSNNITNITQAPNGNIWIWTTWWISVLNKTTWNFTSYTKWNGLVSNTIKSITNTSKWIFVTTDKWISIFNKTTLQFTSYTDVLSSTDINKVVEVSGWNVWVATDDWVSVFNWTYWNSYVDQLVSTNVSTITQVSGWNIWVATDEWISVFDWSNWSEYKDQLINKEVNDIFQSNDNKIWVATNNWVSVFDWVNWNEYAISDWLISESIISIFQDTNNNMWFTTTKGLSELLNGSFINYPNNSEENNSDNNNDWIAWGVYIVYKSTGITLIWIKNN